MENGWTTYGESVFAAFQRERREDDRVLLAPPIILALSIPARHNEWDSSFLPAAAAPHRCPRSPEAAGKLTRFESRAGRGRTGQNMRFTDSFILSFFLSNAILFSLRTGRLSASFRLANQVISISMKSGLHCFYANLLHRLCYNHASSFKPTHYGYLNLPGRVIIYYFAYVSCDIFQFRKSPEIFPSEHVKNIQKFKNRNVSVVQD